MAAKKKKVKKSSPRKTFQVILEVEFTGSRNGVSKRMLDWLLSKEAGTMPKDFLLVKMVKSEEVEVSKALTRARANTEKEEKLDKKRDIEERKIARAQRKKVKAQRVVVRKKVMKKAKEQ